MNSRRTSAAWRAPLCASSLRVCVCAPTRPWLAEGRTRRPHLVNIFCYYYYYLMVMLMFILATYLNSRSGRMTVRTAAAGGGRSGRGTRGPRRSKKTAAAYSVPGSGLGIEVCARRRGVGQPLLPIPIALHSPNHEYLLLQP